MTLQCIANCKYDNWACAQWRSQEFSMVGEGGGRASSRRRLRVWDLSK